MKACIEITLESLTNSLSDKLTELILWNGIGTSLQKSVLHTFWNISKQEAQETVDILWSYGLVQFADSTIYPSDIIQHCVKVHDVISQYIIECTDSDIVYTHFSVVCKNVKLLHEQLQSTFPQAYGVHNPFSLAPMDFLKYQLSEIENVWLPYYLKSINMNTVTDPHAIILSLQLVKDALMSSPHTTNLMSLIGSEIDSLMNDSKRLLKDTHKLCRKLNQSVQTNLYRREYDKIIQSVEEFIKIYPLCDVTQKGITILKKIIPYCDGELLNFMESKCEGFYGKTYEYHSIATLILPYTKFNIKVHKQISGSLLYGSPYIEQTYHDFRSNKIFEEQELVKINFYIKLQEVAPNYVYQQTL